MGGWLKTPLIIKYVSSTYLHLKLLSDFTGQSIGPYILIWKKCTPTVKTRFQHTKMDIQKA